MTKRDPRAFLNKAEAYELKQRQGHLKIYLGAAPGVGKTYQMLTDALVKRAQGIDVVIAAVETHRRQEIESIASAFEKIPYLSLLKGNFKYYALDLDAVIKRSPGLVLIDEAAFSNPEGLQHPKRWQDILELIDKGIDVYTTLNVQHLESLNDVVTKLIGIPIRETVPDAFLERAHSLELIDLPSDDLILRLQQGKVYFPSEVKVAMHHFFRKSNLDILRELALRVAAQRVSSELEPDKLQVAEAGLSVRDDVLLVLINDHLEMPKLIRTAKRISARLNCAWYGLYVDSGDKAAYFKTQLHLQYAESLGAKTAVIFAKNIKKAILNYIETNAITQVVMGQVSQSWMRWFGLAQRLSWQLNDIGLYFVELSTARKTSHFLSQITPKRIFLTCLLVLSALTMIELKNIFSPWDFGWLTGLLILAMAYFGAWRWVFFLMLLFLGLDVLFNERSFELLIGDPWLWLSMYGSWSLLFLSLSAFIIHARREVILAREIEANHQIMFGFYQEIANLRGISRILRAAGQYIEHDFASQVQIYLAQDKSLKLSFPNNPLISLNAKEEGVLQWVFQSAKPAGKGTDNLSFSEALYLPLLSGGRCLGVVRLDNQRKEEMSPAQKKILMICLQQLANILDVEKQVIEDKQQKIREIKLKVKDNLLQGFVEQIYQPLLSVVEMLGNTKAGLNYLSELHHIHGQIKALKYFSDPDSYQEKLAVDFPPWFDGLVQQLKPNWRCQQLRIDATPLLDKVLLHESLMKICFYQLFAEIQLELNDSDEIIVRYFAADDHLLIQINLISATKKMQHILQKLHETLQLSDLFRGFALCHQILVWHGGSIRAQAQNQKNIMIELSLPFAKKIELL
jgi:two-component system sensor histidine kinase KdpD